MDYAFLPPEINSTRMYTGPGTGALLAAAGSWDSLSAELSTTAEGYESTLSDLTSFGWASGRQQTPIWSRPGINATFTPSGGSTR